MSEAMRRLVNSRFGAKAAVRLVRAAGQRRAEPWFILATQIGFAVSCGFISVSEFSPAVRFAIVAAGVILFVFGDQFSRARRDIDQDAWFEDRARMRGSIAYVAERLKLREDKASYSKDKFDTELEQLQRRCLTSIRQIAARQLGVSESDLLANWACAVDEATADGVRRTFSVRYFDADVTDRTPGQIHAVSEELPGAAQAFTTGEIAIVSDTQHVDVVQVFGTKTPYRAILSIPMRYAHEGEEWVIGVVNIDDRLPNRLTIDVQHAVSDLVYFIGLCEVLKQWPSR